MIVAVVNGALTTDQTILDNKTAVSTYFVDAGLNTTDFLLDTVTDDDATVTTAKTAVDAAAETALYTGTTFTLASGTETTTGTTGNDTITGVASSLSSAKTFDTTDIIDGGAGTDRLNLTMNASHTGMTGTGAVTNVENINLTNGGTVSRNFDATGVTGATAYKIDATTGLVTLSDLDSTPTVSLSNYVSAGSFSTAFATGNAALTATTDAMTFTINGLGTVENTATTAVEQKIVTATLTDIETVNVNATGTNVIALAGTDMLALNIAGAGNVTVTSVATSTTSVDASESTGNISVDTTAAAAGALTSVATGSGDDTVTLTKETAGSNATISGGAGADTLTYNTGAVADIVQYSMSGFETLALNTINVAGLTFSGTNVSDLTTVSSNVSTVGAASLVNMGAIDLTVNSLGVTANAGAITSSHTGATILNYTAAAANVTAKTASAPLADYSFTGSTALTVNVGSYVDTTGSDITAASATSVTVNVASGMSSASTPLETSTLGGDMTIAKATSLTINADGKIGVVGTAADIIAAKITSATITATAQTADLDLDAVLLETLTVSSAKAFNMTDSTLTAVQVADLTVNDGAFTLDTALTKISTLTAAGSGVAGTSTAASSFSLAALGGDNAYNMNVTASGLKGGFLATTVNTGAGYDINVDGTGLAGATAATTALTLGAIGATTTGANVTVNTTGLKGAVDLSTIAATGTVTLTNSSTGAYDVGNISSAVAAINTTSTVGAVTIGTITTTGATTITNASTSTFAVEAISAGITGDVTLALDGTLGLVSGNTIAGNNVNVDVSNTIGGVQNNAATVGTMDTITAHTSATLAMSELQANIVSIAGSSTSTALAVALTGGILNDAVTITGGATQTSITVTGDLNSTTTGDSITLTSAAAVNQTVTLAGLSNYDSSTITMVGAANHIITGGTGADNIDMAAALTVLDTIVGGTGSDTLTLTDDTTTTDLDNVSGIEAINITNTGSSTYVLSSGKTLIATDATLTVAGLAAQSINLDLTNNTTNGILVFTGGAAVDTIIGGSGNDNLTGGITLVDVLKGGAGADTIIAGAGGATITGGAGADIITAAGGTDSIVYNLITEGGDTVSAFLTAGTDVINFTESVFTTGVAWGAHALSTTGNTNNYAESTTALSTTAQDLNGTGAAGGAGFVVTGATTGTAGINLYYTTDIGAATSTNSTLMVTLSGINTADFAATDIVGI